VTDSQRAAWDALYSRGAPYHGPAPAPFFASQLPANARVLDLGCGAGKSLAALRAAGPWSLLGVDASRPALRLARGRAHAALAQADAAALPLRDASVDAVRVDMLLGHLRDPLPAAREVERVLRPGGWLECHEFARGDLRDGVGAAEGTGARRGGVWARTFAPGELAVLFPGCDAVEEELVRPVKFAARPRRVLRLRARRS
jgi:SAM-dependent methyltransferase